jgi:hypothetical protein
LSNSKIQEELYPQYFTDDQTANVIHRTYSDIYILLDLDDPTIYDLPTQTLTLPYSQFGRVELNNTNGKIISKINNLSFNFITKFSIWNGSTLVNTDLTFQHTAMASATNGDLVCDAPNSTIVLEGRLFGNDFIEYRQNIDTLSNNYVNLRTNLIKLA